MQRLRSTPLLHFLLLGMVLFGLRQGAWRPLVGAAGTWDPDPEILYRAALTLGIDREARVVRDRLVQLGRFLDLDAQAVPPALEREARDIGLVESDPVIRRHIEHLAELALHHAGAAALPTDAEVARDYDENAARYQTPPRLRLRQVYFSFARHGAAAESLADAALERLRSGMLSSSDVAAMGDPFVQAVGDRSLSDADLAQAFGRHFASALAQLPEQTWAGPVRSTYGLHLVWIAERRAARPVPLPLVQNQIVHRLAREHSERLAARRLALLRQTAAGHAP